MEKVLLVLLLVCSLQRVKGQSDFIQFSQSSYFVTVEEEQPINTTIVTAGVLALDSFMRTQTGTFTLPSTGDARFFTIENTGLDASDTNNAVIRNAIVFDWDTELAQRQFSFPVTFTTRNNFSQNAQITVFIMDINDNTPQFTRDVFEAFISENVPSGSGILNITAIDPDQTLIEDVIVDRGNDVSDIVRTYTVENGRIVYEITSGNELGHFEINPDNGTLSVSANVHLDVDEVDFYNLTVTATDGGGRNNFTTVLINILDANDNAPQILHPRGVDITISEGTPPGYIILDEINATDFDSGLNSLLQFLIIRGDLTQSFSIDETTGEMIVSGSLDREVQSVVNLTVVARDHGIPTPLQDTIYVIVRLLDINDYAPRFMQLDYQVRVRENAGRGSRIAQVTAVDLDEGVNGTITYNIIKGGDGKFTIDPSSGEIFTNGTLDHENVSSYDLVIEATDNPLNSSYQLSSEVNVTVFVEDVNDHAPIFDEQMYMIQILDNVTRQEPLIQLRASDRDSGSNGMITYRIEVPDPSYPLAFRIDENTGTLFRDHPIRFENQSNFTYTIRALDNGPFRLSNDVPIVIILHNVNENSPVFDSPSYNTTVIETIPINSFILTVSASDRDVGAIGEVRYRIVTEFDEAGSFGINENTGQISVASSLDFDFREVVHFVVEAYDGGFPEPFTDRVNVTVFLTGTNDEAPSIIFPEGFHPFVPENTVPEIDVVTLRDYTVDPDLNTGGEFYFSLIEVHDLFYGNNSFSLNETTGLVRSLRVFDRELQPQGIVITVETIDLEGLSRETNITIMIGDLNDNSPYFVTNITATIHEFLEPGTEVVAEFTAVDDDIGSNADLRYSLFDGIGHEMFSMDHLTGGLYTAGVLNKTVQDEYNLTVLVVDQGTPQMFGFGTIYVEVLDSNDMVPIFSQSQYRALFSESDPMGTFFFQVNASDSDIGTNAQIQYFIAPNSSNSERFFLNATTGEIFTNDLFDRENESTLQLTVLAEDGGLVPHSLTASATVLVTIQDFNEHTPFFNDTLYESEVIENAKNGSFVAAVFASDEDAEPPNNVIKYSLLGNRSDAFSIDPDVGVVLVSGEVDWEEGEEFVILIVATDQGVSNTLSSSVELMVTVTDINDNPPVFLQDSLNLTIIENSVPGEEGIVVGWVQSSDADSPGNNSAVTYSILMDFANGRFTLDPDGEVVFVKGSLNREQRGAYDLLIRAIDDGSPRLHTDAVLIITILDSNDFDPVVEQDLYTAIVPERSSNGTFVLAVTATDSDFGSNAELVYVIDSSGSLEVFEVNETSGVVYVASILDYETVSFYTFKVIVSDMGSPSRNTSTRIEITIADSNDIPPVFNQSEYSATIRENLASGTTLLRVFATDNDTTQDNTMIEFSLEEGSKNFGIDPETGVVYTNAYLNREVRSFYNLTVVANNSLSPHPLLARAQVLVFLTDLNDMHPSFDLIVRVVVFENVTVNSIVYALDAVDGDEGSNGTIQYTALQTSQFFCVNSSTGDLILLQPLDYENSQKLFMLPVVANDSGTPSLRNYTNVLIQVLDSNDHPPMFASQNYSITIDSESIIQTPVLRLDVIDRDEESNVLSTSIVGGNSLGLFEVLGDGTVRTTASLRDHVGKSIHLTLRVSDDIFSDEASVTVYIQGGMDTLPRFLSRTYTTEVSETAQNGDIVFEFSFETTNVALYHVNSDVFSIDELRGILTLVDSSLIDFETRSLYQLTISIENSAGNVSYAVLNVEITDENEHIPQFISDSFFVAIPETVGVDVAFFTAIAFDEDGDAPANQISYDISLTDSDTRSYLRMNPQTGELTLTRTLEYESGDLGFNVTIRAFNPIDPSSSATTRLEIVILNGNSFVPEFAAPVYTVHLLEDVATDLSIVNVTATDRDIGSYGQVTFGMHGDHRYLDFRIDTFTGEIFTNAQLDYERSTFYTLEIVASDGGNPARSAIVPVEVFVRDINDNTPVWGRQVYVIDIIENVTVGSSIINVHATDRDQAEFNIIDGESVPIRTSNGYVTYSITQGDPANNFNIDPDTGLVSVMSSLDREIYPRYNLTLTATDGGGLFANAYLSIIIHDVNDKIPSFIESPYVTSLSEDSPNGSLVLSVHANDTDLNRNSEILYYFYNISGILECDFSGTFRIDNRTGDVTLETLLDREDIMFYNLTVIAVDRGDIPLTGTTQVLINVLDINEFPPEFTLPEFSGEVFENEPVGTAILQVNSTDLDFGENGTVFYSIVSGDTDVFTMATESGVISVAGSIDYEIISEYELVVMATDTGPVTERLTDTVNVTITVLDRNDNPPHFSELFYIASIPEDSIPGDLVLNINASDSDSGSNAELVFSLEFHSDLEAGMNFVIDDVTGSLILSDTSDLDRERVPTYDIIVNVSDSGTPSMMNSVLVTVEVTDVNDNIPQFSLPFFEGSIYENLPPNTLVTNISATDADTGNNSDVVFTITRTVEGVGRCVVGAVIDVSECTSLLNESSINATDNPFTVNAITGIIYSLRSLDRERVSGYILEVVATDMGYPQPLANTSLMIIEVLDLNDETPMFTEELYLANISEYSRRGFLVTQVSAVDLDVSSNAVVTYFLLDSGLFTINSMSGEIFAMSGEGYDRETLDIYNLTVVAVDGGTPSLTGSALIVVTVLDENDSPPTFEDSPYFVNIRENLPPKSFVIQLNAVDADIGSNSQLTYHIDSSSPELHFAINSSTGILRTTQPLDRELVGSYTITITALDGGHPSLTGTAQVEVTVTDHNDFPPAFINLPYTASIDENVAPESPLLQVFTFDADLNNNSNVYYSIIQVSPTSSAFEVDQTTGEVFVRSPLDAEVSLIYNVTIRADNGGAVPFQFSETVVGVLVLDQNDHSPMFGQLEYVVPFLETSLLGSTVVELTAFDLDVTNENSLLMFEIVGGYNTDLFNITTESGVGVVSVAGILDRETEAMHVLEVMVYDSGVPMLTSITTLVIELQDVNDNAPVFEQTVYTFGVAENSPLFTLIGRVTANDIDLQNISYFLNNTELFAINSSTGEIFTAAEFDREEQTLYSIIAVATDKGQVLERSGEVVVNISILDVNDVPPSFSNSTYHISLFENTTVPSTVLTVEAIDGDFAENGTFYYSVVSRNDSTFFSINSTSGEMLLELELDRETKDLLEILVSATDFGEPSLTGSVIVIVTVRDNNDNNPVFNSSHYTAVLPEDTPTGTIVVVVGASDQDTGRNSDITFSLSNNFFDTFSIGEKNGIIVTSGGLDYERAENYSFSVIAEDNGELISLFNSSDVFIEVVDINDNEPVFDSDSYQVFIPENEILETEIFQIPATDADSTSNGELRYSILSGNLHSAFSVDEVFGKILVSDYLDREITPSYLLTIRAVDQGVPQFTATAELAISILDVNDHNPMFGSKTYSVSVPESSAIGTRIFQFRATDLDVGNNANLSFSLIAGNEEDMFEIGSDSGDLMIANQLDSELVPSYALSVLVSDNGSPDPLVDTATIRILVTDQNEHAPTFHQSTYYINISQNVVIGSPIGHFIATDQDIASQGTLHYHLVDRMGFFEIDSLEGSLYVNRVLTPGHFLLSLEVTDGDFITSVDINVIVLPLAVAMVMPIFDAPTYYFEISESAEIGSVVGQVIPMDTAIVDNVTGNVFTIDSNGTVVVIGYLDYEAAGVYVVNVVTTGMVGSPLYVVMTIRVLDANDNPPVFESASYAVSIMESTPLGTTLATIQAFDVDQPGNSTSYRISLSCLGNEGKDFDLDPSTGVLTTSNMLDYERNSSYILTLVAVNGIAVPALSSTAQVTVSLLDENDNAPQFNQMFYRISIPESTPIGTNILTLDASDADSGTNSELVFSITHLSELLTFTINQTSGTISTNATYNSEEMSFHIISASVTDRGNPQPLSSSTSIFIEVTPDNIGPPVFSNPGGYNIDVPETLEIGGSVVQVSASDFTGSESIIYSIELGNLGGIFSIDPSTGLVSLLSSLDFNTQSAYSLVVQAVDSGTPPRMTSVGVNITVLDLNNHNPQFEQAAYQVSVYENITIGTSILQTVATDMDTVNITYQITVNSYAQGLPLFSIDYMTGVIVTAASIDREMADRLEILVSAIDSGYPVRRSTSIPVIVDVMDLNDNPPVFTQSEFNLIVLRLLSARKAFAQLMATDADVVGENLTYTIITDDSDGLFRINPRTAVIETSGRIPETTSGYQLNVTVFDGTFVTSVRVNLLPGDNGDFCEDGGFCTSVREVNCTFDIFPFIDCNPFCAYPGPTLYSLSPEERVCLNYMCLDPFLVPCIAEETCQPVNVACSSVCPSGMSLCPTTNLCHMTTFSQSCDDSNVTCLVGQILVQRNDSTRYCAVNDTLPINGQTCDGSSVYCEELGRCMNRNATYLCQACPGELFLCPNGDTCVPDLIECCNTHQVFCEDLNLCLEVGERCQLPNIAPRVTSDLIYLESLTDFDETTIYLSEGHVISVLLGNGTEPAVDSQEEEVSIAIIGTSEVLVDYGEWQVLLEQDINWRRLDTGQLSETDAVVLPSTARLRFVRKSIVLDGAVWLRVKLWDGNTDGFLSPRQDLVRSHDLSYSSTLPYTPNGAFSERSLLLVVLLHPVNLPPFFNPMAILQFTRIQEDSDFFRNLGNTLTDLVISVDIPDFQLLSENGIDGFPDEPTNTQFEQLLPLEARNSYLDDVRGTRLNRLERRDAHESGQLPGVAVTFDPNSPGVWQIAFSDDPKLFLNISSIVDSSEADVVLLNISARLRFLPEPNFCGMAFILLAPWDGFWNSSLATRLPNSYIVTSSPWRNLSSSADGLSPFNINRWERAELAVDCVADTPQITRRKMQLSPLPYRMAHQYERLFTLLMDRETESLRGDEMVLSNYLQIVLNHPVNLKRFSPALQGRTFVSFSVVSDRLNFEELTSLIQQSRDTLALLNFDIISLTQDAAYGPGAGCSGDTPADYHGDHINSLLSSASFDGDEDFLGLAVIGATPTIRGVWQYNHGNWTVGKDLSSQYNPDSNIWVNFPSQLSETNAFLLHGNDRIRFLPYPEFFWSSEPPSLLAKVWDNTIGQFSVDEVSTMNVNTDPAIDTVQSLHRLIGIFSSAVLRIEAARYGCDGVVNSGAVHDVCCVCGGNGETCEGCDGVRGSNVGRDSCDVCGGSSSCVGCDLIPFSGTELGQCLVCMSQISVPTSSLNTDSLFTNPSFTDCHGDCHGNALIDNCGVCSSGRTSHDFDSDMDCAGSCYGNATIDSCGDCTGPGTDIPNFNQNLDCTNVCNGHFLTDSCDVCQLPNHDGSVEENRDCSGKCFGQALTDRCGVCYGGITNVSADSVLDRCGVCHGDETTCVGCDGVVASGRSVDLCGECDGNNCGCFLLDSLFPNGGLTLGGTRITLHGAGFFLNNTALLGFGFDKDATNCGAPMRFLNDSSVPIVCQFSLGNEILRVPAVPLNQSSILCISSPAASSGPFMVQVSINNGPFSNHVEYIYHDYSLITLDTVSPLDLELNSELTINFFGEGFVNSSFSACLIYESRACTSPPSPPPSSGYISVPLIFVSHSEVRCVLPPAATPCRVRVLLSLDGQESGRIGSETFITFRSSPPYVTNVYFLDDLSGLLIQFDKRSRLTNDSTQLSCSAIFDERTFDMIGGLLAECSWTDSSQSSITVTLPNSAEIKVESPITFKNGAIETRDTLYSFSITNITVLVGPSSIQPIAVIDGPSSIPFCGTVTFSGIHSQYPGYSGFEYYWSILVLDSTIQYFSEISQYLNNLTTNSSTISLNSDLFLENVIYSVQLYVVSSIGLRSETESMQLLKDSRMRLQVVVLGVSERVIVPDEDLLIQSIVTQPTCSAEQSLQFVWELIRIVDSRRNVTVMEDISGIKTGSHLLTIPNYLFMENTRYRVNLAVSTLRRNLDTSSTSLGVTVLPVSLKARIHGGNRTLSIMSELVLDARNSTSSLEFVRPTFTWICTVVGSLDACYNQSLVGSPIPVPIMLPHSDFVSFPSSTLAAGRSYVFTLRMEQESVVSEDSVVMQVVNSSLPMVELSGLNSNFQFSEEIVLSGFVYSTLSLQNVQWESIQLEGQGFIDLSNADVLESQTSYSSFDPSSLSDSSTIPLAAHVLPNMVNRVNLILSPNTLEPRLSYTFRLLATSSAGTSYAEITIKTESPPKSATLTSNPSSGVALETEFELEVSGALDSVQDSPFLYQFGIVTDSDVQSVEVTIPLESIQWISAIQSSPTFTSALPSGDERNNFTLVVCVRVFDRKGVYSDFLSRITVLQNTLSSDFYSSRISHLQSELAATKEWSSVVSQLTAYLFEFSKQTSTSSVQVLKEQSLHLFLDIFDNYLPSSSAHYIMASSIFSLITSNQGITDPNLQRRLSERSLLIAEWFKNETTVTPSFTSIPTLASGQPLFLQSGYQVLEKELLSTAAAAALLSPWINLVETNVMDAQVTEMFIRGTEMVSNVLCQQSSTGEKASFVSSSLVDVYVISSPPLGTFNVSKHLVNFGSSAMEVYQSQACQGRGVACSEACVVGISFQSDLIHSSQMLQLSNTAQQMIIHEIEGSDPLRGELISNVVSLSISIPSQDLYLAIQNLDDAIHILIPVSHPLPNNDSLLLCLYREVGGASGYGNYDWLLDYTSPPPIVEVESVQYYSCPFHHLSEFAIGILPPPVITDPPPTDTSQPPPTTDTTIATTARVTEESTEPPVSRESTGSPAGAIATVVVVVLLMGVVVGVVIFILCVWWKKKKRKMKILPDDSENKEEPVPVELLNAEPLTPAESKITMDIIQCLEEGKRTRLGKMKVLPSIRLRELRFEIIENFPNLKNKPFYFLTRQLCDIEPTTEQQQFVSIVFGNKPIFIREVTVDNMQTKKHFCVCGNAAQFECSNCSSQGYCCQECQTRHWVDRHQKECSRLSEKKRRSDVLYNRQNTSLPFTQSLSPISESPQRAPMGLPSPTSPVVAAPGDWKRNVPQQNLFPPRTRSISVPGRNVTTLASLAKQTSVQQLGQPPMQAPPKPHLSLGALKGVPLSGNYSHLSRSSSVQRPYDTRPSLTRMSIVRNPTSLPLVSPQSPVATNDNRPSLTRMSTITRNPTSLPLVSPQSPVATNIPSTGRLSVQSPLESTPQDPFFIRPPVRKTPIGLPAPVRQLSIQSVGSADFAMSPQSPRSDPILEVDEGGSRGSEDGSGSGEESVRLRTSSGSRPPSLAVKRKKSRAVESSSSSSSSESSEESSEENKVTKDDN